MKNKDIEEPLEQFEKRKAEHLRLALERSNQSHLGADFESVELLHEALPKGALSDVDLKCDSLGRKVGPFFISSMTAGHAGSLNVNHRLAVAAAHCGWRMGVGSQRRELFDSAARQEWAQLRAQLPQVRLLGNLGLAQVIHCDSVQIEALVESLGAEAIFVHLNPLQEALQKEGTPNFTDGERALERLCAKLPVPVVVKETGCGMTLKTMRRLRDCGVRAIDVAGRGGTHWGLLEGARAEVDSLHARAAKTFGAWGISTVDSLLAAKELMQDVEIWASGGVRSGLDAAKCFALGAVQVGLAHSLLAAAIEDEEKLIQEMQRFEFELRIALFCTGSVKPCALQDGEKWRIRSAK